MNLLYTRVGDWMQRELIEWYELNKRDLPWRHSEDAYNIWISEIMLQQTMVDTVIPYYLRFIDRFPDINTLAMASLEEVYKYWEGLGYYRRARFIHENAVFLHENNDDTFPDEYEEILSLKGIGRYTAGAICSIAYKMPIPAVDGNVLRVISRFYCIDENIALDKTVKMIENKVNELIKGYDPSAFNQGLMDLSAAICRVKNPDCMMCPLNKECLAFRNHQENVLPIKMKKVKKKEIHYITGIVTNGKRFLLIKNGEGLLENLYGFVQYECDSPYIYIDYFESEYGRSLRVESFIKRIKHVFSHRTWIMDVYHFEIEDTIENMYTKKEIELLPISTAHLKVYKAFLKKD